MHSICCTLLFYTLTFYTLGSSIFDYFINSMCVINHTFTTYFRWIILFYSLKHRVTSITTVDFIFIYLFVSIFLCYSFIAGPIDRLLLFLSILSQRDYILYIIFFCYCAALNYSCVHLNYYFSNTNTANYLSFLYYYFI
jgi:hypothetical protein